MKNNYYEKDINGNEILYLNSKDGFYLKFEQEGPNKKVSLYCERNHGRLILVFNDLIKSSGYVFKYKGSKEKYSFVIEFSKKRIKIIQPVSLKGEKEKERPYYVFSLLHEIGHSYLHKSQGVGFERLKRELQAWTWAIEQAQVLLPEYLELVDKEGLKFFVTDCLKRVRMYEGLEGGEKV